MKDLEVTAGGAWVCVLGRGSQGDLAALSSGEEKCYDERPRGRFVSLWPDGTCQLQRLDDIKTACLHFAQHGLINV